MKKYLKPWEIQTIVIGIISGLLALLCNYYRLPMVFWGIGIFSGIIIGYLPTEKEMKDEQREEN